MSEPAAGSRRRRHPHRSRGATATDYVIDGQKTFITNGTRADFITLLAKTTPDAGAHGCSFFLVPTALPGFAVAKKLEKIGNHASDTAELFFDDVRVPKRVPARRGEPGLHVPHAELPDRAARSPRSARCAGARLVARGRRRSTARERTAFGKPIIKREVWQHKFVDLYTKVEMPQAFVYKCVDQYNDERYVKKEPLSFETVKLISMAKIAAGDAGLARSWTTACSSTAAGATSRTSRSRAPGAISASCASAAGRPKTMRYYIAKLMGF